MDREQSITQLRELVAHRRLAEARDFCLHLTETHPRDIEIWMMRGGMHYQRGEFMDVAECCRRVIEIDSDHVGAYFSLGLALQSLGRLEEAESAYHQVLHFNRHHAKTLVSLSELLSSQKRFEEARDLLEKALMSLPPEAVFLTFTLGALLMRTGQPAAAIAAYDRAVAMAPDDALAHCARSEAYLALGDFERGWPEHEWRLRLPEMSTPPTCRPRWRGEPVAGKTILLIGEQGAGDIVQFVRYARQLKAQAAKVWLVCRPALRRLLAGCDGIDAVFNDGDCVPPYDFDIPVLSLPWVFKTQLDTIPAEVPYLHFPPGAGAAAVREISRHSTARRAGIVWAGSKHYPGDRRRSCGLAALRGLFAIQGVRFFSLQKDDAALEISTQPTSGIIDLSRHLNDFSDTAAAITALDLVISVDTCVAHIAGALARPVWTLLPFEADWRWLLNREDSPWYPTMRLFRQPAPGDWASVVGRVSRELKALVEAK